MLLDRAAAFDGDRAGRTQQARLTQIVEQLKQTPEANAGETRNNEHAKGEHPKIIRSLLRFGKGQLTRRPSLTLGKRPIGTAAFAALRQTACRQRRKEMLSLYLAEGRLPNGAKASLPAAVCREE
jgi:hypothetical protein